MTPIPVVTPFGLPEHVPLHQLSEVHKSYVRSNKTKAGGILVAKKYLKAQQALEDLQCALGNFDGQTPLPTFAPSAPTPRLAEQRLALVPFVPTVGIDTTRQPHPRLRADDGWYKTAAQLTGSLLRSYGAFYPVKLLWIIARWLLYLAWIAPVLLAYWLRFMMMSQAAYVISHPELLVTWSFEFIDLGPIYIKWASDRMLGQAYNETIGRLR